MNSVLNTLSEYIHTFIYRKTLLYTLFCLFLILQKAFSVSLKGLNPVKPEKFRNKNFWFSVNERKARKVSVRKTMEILLESFYSNARDIG